MRINQVKIFAEKENNKMADMDLLKEIHKENKSMNRNIQVLVYIGLIGLLGNLVNKAKKDNDNTGKLLAKIGLFLVAVYQVLLFICDVIDFKNSIEEDKTDI